MGISNPNIHTHRDTTVIHKLTHNLPLTEKEYGELERILTRELGTAEDYERNYQDTPFGLLVRKIAGMDHDTVQGVFADFINQEKLNQRQINFVNRVIAYIEKNGYIRETEDLTHAPFDFPAKIFELFDPARCRKLFEIITRMKENAEKHMA